MHRILGLRNRHLFILDSLALVIIPALALTLRVDGLGWWPETSRALFSYTLVAYVVKMSIFYMFGLYNRYWRYASVSEMFWIFAAVSLATLIIGILYFGLQMNFEEYVLGLPRSVPVLDGVLTFFAIGGFRFGLRGLNQWYRQNHGATAGRRVLIVGAGEAGAMVALEILANPELEMEVVAFVDDDESKLYTRIHGIPVLGSCGDIHELVNQYLIQRLIVAIPSAPLKRRQELATLCEQTEVPIHNLTGMYELLAGHKTINVLPEFDLNRLLRREPSKVNHDKISTSLCGEIVLVTGAGGSIGSELCRQIARADPKEIILLGHGENSIFEIGLSLSLSFPNLIFHQIIADIKDQKLINSVVQKHRPTVIFHAAAHKHVHFAEANIPEAVNNNIQGTWNVLRAAEQYGVERFVLISTDKAVNPTSIMGVTKRIAELLVLAASQRQRRAYILVRFGNVLGSRGSVIPIFQQQIARGGPVTITHPDVTRYFMTIPEAVHLVLLAAEHGEKGQVFTLDMGEPVRILDMASDLIQMSGLQQDRDIKIVYTNMQPGEKLKEELFIDNEEYQRVDDGKIFVGKCVDEIDIEKLELNVSRLCLFAKMMQIQDTLRQMRVIIPEYRRDSRLLTVASDVNTLTRKNHRNGVQRVKKTVTDDIVIIVDE